MLHRYDEPDNERINLDLCREGISDMLEVKSYDSMDDSLLKFAVIVSQSNGR